MLRVLFSRKLRQDKRRPFGRLQSSFEPWRVSWQSHSRRRRISAKVVSVWRGSCSGGRISRDSAIASESRLRRGGNRQASDPQENGIEPRPRQADAAGPGAPLRRTIPARRRERGTIFTVVLCMHKTPGSCHVKSQGSLEPSGHLRRPRPGRAQRRNATVLHQIAGLVGSAGEQLSACRVARSRNRGTPTAETGSTRRRRRAQAIVFVAAAFPAKLPV
jgi:hypothetical protein